MVVRDRLKISVWELSADGGWAQRRDRRGGNTAVSHAGAAGTIVGRQYAIQFMSLEQSSGVPLFYVEEDGDWRATAHRH